MALKFSDLSQLYMHSFDAVIDVRSPAEFAEDHLPEAINLPVLDNEERAAVGTIYVQQNPFLARKVGAAMVFRNAAAHIENSLSHHEGGWKPLVYCWRGGQRSGSFSWMLQQIGWRAEVIEGGYRSYRRLVNKYLYQDPLPLRIVALDGNTGTAKTELLQLLQTLGIQVLDLEGLANHRGSLLGERPGGQPTQKAFESALAKKLCEMDKNRPVVVEAESSKIGNLLLPPSFWTALCNAPRILVSAPIELRTTYLVKTYDDILSDHERLRDRLSPLRFHRGHSVVDSWLAMIESNDKHALTLALMEQHYDLAYAKSRRCQRAEIIAKIELATLDNNGLATAASRVQEVLAQL
ncbi:tRNA 2-selenouridine(34) synthase MnmH [Ruegeria arenilitoris]|uniref:tRNA 2-selenouridine(34) synthase MnmH n=1 Tax=Ruegeria arenilitoris TaxID=1173585 RepID=UPI00147BCD54|nr:tRNA 2-selenouridine(34) synthase MnmH [Ruegeria arenilitoris]